MFTWKHTHIDGTQSLPDIRDELDTEIKNILTTGINSLYRKDWYHHSEGRICITTPRMGTSRHIPLSDTIRHHLSLVADKNLLHHISHIVMRPRFIQSNGIELSAIYLPSQKVLVMYLTSDHVNKSSDLPQLESALKRINQGFPTEPLTFFTRNRFLPQQFPYLENISFSYERMGY